MSILLKATSGVLIRPQVLAFYGVNGVGKTTLASRFPLPLILDLEDGSGFITDPNVLRIGKNLMPDLEAYLEILADLLKDSGDRKTLVTDSIEALESLVQRAICKTHKVESIEDINFGKGMVMAREKMGEIMHLFHRLRDEKKLHVILVGHSITKSHTDPKSNLSYDRHVMRANDKFSAVIRDLCDGVYFINHKTLTETSKQNPNKAKAFTTGERVIYTTWSHAHDAKSRFQLPEEINYSLQNISEAVELLIPKTGEDLVYQIGQLRLRVTDKELGEKIDKAIAESGKDEQKLRNIKSRLTELTQTT